MLLEVRDLKTHFFTSEGVIRAVDGVSFELEAGRSLGIVGESGSGKSVTALSLLRLVPEPPARIVGGSVRLDGRDVLSLAPEELRKLRGVAAGVVFQDPMTSLNPVLTIGFQVAEALRAHDPAASRETVRARAIDMLRRVGIPEPETRFDDYPHRLSGGMRQRVMIAQALVNRPKLLIADEPTTALDVTIQAQILELLAALRRDLSMAVILITHDLGLVSGFVDDVIVMYAGQVVEMAPAAELFAEPLHPYTRALIASVPRLRGQLGRLPSIEGQVPSPFALPSGCRFRDRCPLATPRCASVEPPLESKRPGRVVRCIEV